MMMSRKLKPDNLNPSSSASFDLYTSRISHNSIFTSASQNSGN